MGRSGRIMPFVPLAAVVFVGALNTFGVIKLRNTTSGTYGPAGKAVEAALAAPGVYRDPRGILALADAQFASDLMIRPDAQRRIAQIVTELDQEITEFAKREIQQWNDRGGSKAEVVPGFTHVVSPASKRVQSMRVAAERRIRALLSADERKRADRALSTIVFEGVASPVVPAEARN
jgi:hypothetical protein